MNRVDRIVVFRAVQPLRSSQPRRIEAGDDLFQLRLVDQLGGLLLAHPFSACAGPLGKDSSLRDTFQREDEDDAGQRQFLVQPFGIGVFRGGGPPSTSS